MWICTPHGFYSAVAARHSDGTVDATRVVVRARTVAHLAALVARFPRQLGDVRILHTDGGEADYACRIVLDKATWAYVTCSLSMQIDYDNFKDAAARQAGDDPAACDYVDALHGVWSLLRELQVPRW